MKTLRVLSSKPLSQESKEKIENLFSKKVEGKAEFVYDRLRPSTNRDGDVFLLHRKLRNSCKKKKRWYNRGGAKRRRKEKKVPQSIFFRSDINTFKRNDGCEVKED